MMYILYLHAKCKLQSICTVLRKHDCRVCNGLVGSLSFLILKYSESNITAYNFSSRTIIVSKYYIKFVFIEHLAYRISLWCLCRHLDMFGCREWSAKRWMFSRPTDFDRHRLVQFQSDQNGMFQCTYIIKSWF